MELSKDGLRVRLLGRDVVRGDEDCDRPGSCGEGIGERRVDLSGIMGKNGTNFQCVDAINLAAICQLAQSFQGWFKASCPGRLREWSNIWSNITLGSR